MNERIIGHERERTLLRTLVSDSRLPHHAFLISGPESIGKSLVAAEFAAALLGIEPEKLTSSQDFRRIAPKMKKSGQEAAIPIESVRDAGVFLSRFPAESGRRVLLIESADRMSDGAQNAILKTLEEPNDTSVLILTSARPGGIRETLRSRSFPVACSLVPEERIREGVEASFDAAARDTIEPFFYSLGRPGIIVSALEDPDHFASRRDMLRSLITLSKATPFERIALAEKLADSVPEALRLLEWWASGLRAMKRDEADPRQIRATYRLLEAIEETSRLLRSTNANARLLLDKLFLVSV